MPLFIFFVNKPLTIIPYLLGLFLLLGVTALDLEIFPLPFIFFFICFTMWYAIFLVYYYVLRNADNEILGIQVSQFRNLFFTILWILGLILVASCIGIGYFKSSFGSIFFLFGFSAIFLFIFQSIIEAKLVTEGLKKNQNITDLNFNDVYSDIRKLILTKVIKK